MAAEVERVEAAPLPLQASLVSDTYMCCVNIVELYNFCSKAHIQTVGVRRTAFGSGGKPVNMTVNAFPITIPEGLIYHYDGQCIRFSRS